MPSDNPMQRSPDSAPSGCCEEHFPSAAMSAEEQRGHVCPACSWAPPDDLPYGRLFTPLPPMVDDIGVAIIKHGERGHDLDPYRPEACLCGRWEPYLMCPGAGIEALTLSLDEEGKLRAE